MNLFFIFLTVWDEEIDSSKTDIRIESIPKKARRENDSWYTVIPMKILVEGSNVESKDAFCAPIYRVPCWKAVEAKMPEDTASKTIKNHPFGAKWKISVEVNSPITKDSAAPKIEIQKFSLKQSGNMSS